MTTTTVSQEAREVAARYNDMAHAKSIVEAVEQGCTYEDRCLAVRDLLARHRQQAKRGEAWRPIETAPKDGTWFLAYWPVQTFEDRIQTTQWLHGDCRFVDASDFMDCIQPTHWQPLPTPPEAV